MKKINNILRWTVLVYTLVLVILGVIMATVILNVAVQLSTEYDLRNIDLSLNSIIKSKSDLTYKYAKDLNANGSWFVDIVGCPTNYTMSGATLRQTNLSSQLTYTWWIISCEWSFNGNPVSFYFNSGYSDLQFAQYLWSQLITNSWSTSWNFPDAENTFIDLSLSFPLVPDGIDDNFNSDNYTISSTWSQMYPNWYVDDDAGARLLSYWYVLDNSWLYNIFWSNTKMKQYIENNSNNTDTIYKKIQWLSNWYLKLDINKTFKAVLYIINKSSYDETNELIIQNTLVWTGELATIWYLQNDMSIASGTWSAFQFDFTSFDYALFIENTSGSGALLYKVQLEDALTGSWVYMNPLDDSQTGILWYLGSHILIDAEGRLIWEQLENFTLK